VTNYRSRTAYIEVIAHCPEMGWACSAHVKLGRRNEPEIVGNLFGFEQYGDEGEIVARPYSHESVPADVIEALEARAAEAYLERTEPESEDER
jgi:hypothetical protein